MPENHEPSTGRKPDFFVEHDTNKKDAHRHDSNFDGPRSAPSFIWTPFLKKRKIVIDAILLIILSTQIQYSVLSAQYSVLST